MKRSDIDIDKKFIDMGMDSIIGVEWIKAINKRYGISVPSTKRSMIIQLLVNLQNTWQRN